MSKLFQNKNALLMVLSGVILVAALIISSIAISQGKKNKELEISESIRESRAAELSSLAALNETTTEKSASKNEIGTYIVNTKDDPLGMRLEPNTASNRIVDVPKGEEVQVIATWNDWGYIVYNGNGGWVSMNYLKSVNSEKADKASE